MESAKLLVLSKVSKIDIKKELSWGNHYRLEQKSNSYDKLFPNKSLKKLKTKKYSSETFYNRFKKDLLPLTQRSSRKITKNNNVSNKNYFLNRLALSRSQYTKVLSAPNIHIPENKTKTLHKNKNKPTTTKNASYSSPRIEELAKPNRRNVLETWQHYGYLLEAPKIESIKELLCKEPNISIETAKHFFKQRDRKKIKKRRRMKQKKQKRLNFIKKQANITTEVIAKYFLLANADISSHLILLMSDIILNLLADLLSFKRPISRSSKNPLKKILIKFSDKAANWIALLYKLIDLSYSQNEDYSSHQSSESSDVSQKDESAYSFSDTYINDLESENEDYNNYTYVITSQGKIFQTLNKASQSYLQESILNRDVTQETNWSKTKILDKIQDKASSKQIENILLEWALLNPDDIDEKTQQKILKMSQILTGIVDPESLEQSIRVWSLQEKSLSNLSNSPNIDIEILGTNKAEAKVLLNEITRDSKSIQTRQEMINGIEKNIPKSIGNNPKEKQNYSLKISNLSNFQNVDIEIPGDNKSEMKGFFNELMNDSESGQTIQKIINHIEKCNQESLRNNSRQKQNYSFQISINSNGIQQLLEDLIHKTVNKEELGLDKKESNDSITQNIQEIMNDIHTTIEDIKQKIEKHYEKRIQEKTYNLKYVTICQKFCVQFNIQILSKIKNMGLPKPYSDPYIRKKLSNDLFDIKKELSRGRILREAKTTLSSFCKISLAPSPWDLSKVLHKKKRTFRRRKNRELAFHKTRSSKSQRGVKSRPTSPSEMRPNLEKQCACLRDRSKSPPSRNRSHSPYRNCLIDRMMLTHKQYTEILSAPNTPINTTRNESAESKYRTKNNFYFSTCSPRIHELAKPNQRNVLGTWQNHGYLMGASSLERLKSLLYEEQQIDVNQARKYFKINDRKRKIVKKIKRLKASKRRKVRWLKKQIKLTSDVIFQYLNQSVSEGGLTYKRLIISDTVLNHIKHHFGITSLISRNSMIYLHKILLDVSDRLANWLDAVYSFAEMQEFDELTVISETYDNKKSMKESCTSIETLPEENEDYDEGEDDFFSAILNDQYDKDDTGHPRNISSLEKLIEILQKAPKDYLHQPVLNEITRRTILSEIKLLDRTRDEDEPPAKQIENVLLEWAEHVDPDSIDDRIQHKIVEVSEMIAVIVSSTEKMGKPSQKSFKKTPTQSKKNINQNLKSNEDDAQGFGHSKKVLDKKPDDNMVAQKTTNENTKPTKIFQQNKKDKQKILDTNQLKTPDDETYKPRIKGSSEKISKDQKNNLGENSSKNEKSSLDAEINKKKISPKHITPLAGKELEKLPEKETDEESLNKNKISKPTESSQPNKKAKQKILDKNLQKPPGNEMHNSTTKESFDMPANEPKDTSKSENISLFDEINNQKLSTKHINQLPEKVTEEDLQNKSNTSKATNISHPNNETKQNSLDKNLQKLTEYEIHNPSENEGSLRESTNSGENAHKASEITSKPDKVSLNHETNSQKLSENKIEELSKKENEEELPNRTKQQINDEIKELSINSKNLLKNNLKDFTDKNSFLEEKYNNNSILNETEHFEKSRNVSQVSSKETLSKTLPKISEEASFASKEEKYDNRLNQEGTTGPLSSFQQNASVSNKIENDTVASTSLLEGKKINQIGNKYSSDTVSLSSQKTLNKTMLKQGSFGDDVIPSKRTLDKTFDKDLVQHANKEDLVQFIPIEIQNKFGELDKNIYNDYEINLEDETIEGSKSSKASLVIKGHKPSSVVEHSNDAVCCLSLKIWAVWLLEITHNAHNWTVWISNLIYEIRQFAAILRGEVFLPNGQIKVLFRDDWNKFIAEMEDNTVAWMQYSRHVKDLTQSIVDKFHNKKVACCPKCLQDHLIKDVVRAHQTIRALTEALNCAGYWQRCLDEIVQQTSKLTYVTKKYNSEESVTGWSYSTSPNFSGDNLTNYNNTDGLTGALIKEQRPCKCALKQLYPSEQESNKKIYSSKNCI